MVFLLLWPRWPRTDAISCHSAPRLKFIPPFATRTLLSRNRTTVMVPILFSDCSMSAVWPLCRPTVSAGGVGSYVSTSSWCNEAWLYDAVHGRSVDMHVIVWPVYGTRGWSRLTHFCDLFQQRYWRRRKTEPVVGDSLVNAVAGITTIFRRLSSFCR